MTTFLVLTDDPFCRAVGLLLLAVAAVLFGAAWLIDRYDRRHPYVWTTDSRSAPGGEADADRAKHLEEAW